jgi:hypothetical protein
MNRQQQLAVGICGSPPAGGAWRSDHQQPAGEVQTIITARKKGFWVVVVMCKTDVLLGSWFFLSFLGLWFFLRKNVLFGSWFF